MKQPLPFASYCLLDLELAGLNFCLPVSALTESRSVTFSDCNSAQPGLSFSNFEATFHFVLCLRQLLNQRASIAAVRFGVGGDDYGCGYAVAGFHV